MRSSQNQPSNSLPLPFLLPPPPYTHARTLVQHHLQATRARFPQRPLILYGHVTFYARRWSWRLRWRWEASPRALAADRRRPTRVRQHWGTRDAAWFSILWSRRAPISLQFGDFNDLDASMRRWCFLTNHRWLQIILSIELSMLHIIYVVSCFDSVWASFLASLSPFANAWQD